MVGKKRIILKSTLSIFSIELCQRYTFVCGDSGTGKTQFVKMLDSSIGCEYDEILHLIENEIYTGSDRYSYSDCSVKVISEINDVDDIDPTKECVYVIDENVCSVINRNNSLSSKLLSRIVYKKDGKYSNSYFLFMSRVINRRLEFDVLQTYNMEKEEKYGCSYFTLRRCYDWVNDIPVKVDYMITEGSGSDYKFFSKTVDCEVISAKGKSEIIKHFINLAKTNKMCNIFIFADGAVFGYWLQILLRYKDLIDGVELRLFIPPSFEYLILLSGLVYVDKDIMTNTSKYCDSETYYSYESFYYRKLQDLTNKRPIPDWLLKELGDKINYNKFKMYRKSIKNNAFLEDILMSDVGVKCMKTAIEEIKNIG